MVNDEDARLLIEEVLDRFAFHSYVNGLKIHAILAAIKDGAKDIVEEMISMISM
jgi:hypothetical protein